MKWVTATLKVVVTGEFHDDEASEETLRYCVEQDLEDAGFDVDVELLKEQEPRVMTSSELQPDELVWIEVPQSNEIWPALLRKTDWFDHPTWKMCGYALAAYYLHDGYGRDWRCWTAKPTEDQRLAAKWK